jgi:L-fucose isomerase-like protein
VLNAAKNYFVAKRIMAAENCQGISLNCLRLVETRRIPCPPCMAWQKLNDEGSVGCCECDWNAAISLRLCALLLGRPGFMQDPAPNTINGTLMGAHCSSPAKLRGFEDCAEPTILRSHSESEIGVSPQVLWPLGEPVTVMKFTGPDKLIVGTGQVAANIDTPPCGGCRTSVELKMDNVEDPRDCKGFHQLFILGKHNRLLRAYCQLAGIEAVPIV